MLIVADSGDEDAVVVRPSEAFCKGLDREEEYDNTDHHALASGLDEDRPGRQTEVRSPHC